jgi:hypothetical protein
MAASLGTFMSSINLALQGLQASSQYVKEVQGGEIQQGATGLIQIAGAEAAAATSDPEIQAEATLATEIATFAVPILSDFINLFKKKAAANTAAKAAATAAATAAVAAAAPAPASAHVPAASPAPVASVLVPDSIIGSVASAAATAATA